MATRDVCDLLILHGPDANEWCHYLVSLFETYHQVQDLAIQTYEVKCEPIPNACLETFQSCKCILILLSGDLEGNFDYPEVLESLRTVLRPPNKVIVLFCGVIDKEDFTNVFQDWLQWKQLSSEDDPELYITTVKDIVFEDSGCDSVTDTDPECDEDRLQHMGNIQEKLLSIQPERIRCGVKTQIYLIFKCKLDSQIKNMVYFNPLNGPSISLPASLQNEYILSVDAPDFPSGLVFLKVFSGDLVMCEAKITYFTDMEEISLLLDSATNPIEFMCQAFKIMPYNREALDKLLTESLRKNIPASGLHLFGINQIEEENLSANQRDEELPTLLHFSAKYGLKNLTSLLLTCPGALQAYSVANKHGDFPNNIAEKYGYKDLRQFIDEYVETVDMLKSHIKEELMHGDPDGDPTYESMANLQTDLLMKCSLHPGSDEDLYETMVGMVAQYDPEETYVDMMQVKDVDPSVETHALTAKETMLRKILEGSSLDVYDGNDAGDEEDPYHLCSDKLYDTVSEGTLQSSVAMSRPPVPVPRLDEPTGSETYISQVFTKKAPMRKENIYVDSSNPIIGASVRMRGDRHQSSDYDPFVGMKTPGQRELITLQERVKLGIISVDEAVLEFKEWQLNQKKRSDSFRYQQENLKKLRDSINRRRNEDKKVKKTADLEITKPIRRGQNLEAKSEFGIYEPTSNIVPQKTEIKRGNWKTDSTSSTASSSSNRSSTRSTLSLSSGMEGDNEDNEIPEHPPQYKPRHSLPEERPPPRPPRIPSQRSQRSQSTSANWNVPPVPPRGR